ncbi:2-hydroxyacid dehydrogenase [Rhizobium straminoryzae]|uniref:2-hydroxyacid dehydrogenase n=1 Tax=Rhizobium straminoryzae TaxID=1387186 RepID=A0A549TCQ8_9HYPH|nr:2-hydroxyacid dehydrogenase [Rhizobium straminoryzae]TRL39686.1 2-hydroxyacid dehydrogenase [Rhizobium straminoryzae]
MTDTKITVLVPGRMHPRALERLQAAFDVIQTSAGAEMDLSDEQRGRIRGAATLNRMPAAWIDQLPALEVISNFGVGYDGVDAGHAGSKGILVTNTPDVLNDEVADTTIGLLLNTVRRLPVAETWLREGRWEKEGPFPLTPLSLKNRHVGLLGLGRIGLEIARRLEPFKVKISYHTRTPREGVPYTYAASLLDLARSVDTLISIVPATPETHKIINADVLQALGPNGVFINVGRGTSVDEADLEAALKAGTIAAAGLDVFYHEPKVPAGLLDLPNASLLPHVASASVPTRNDMADLVVDNLIGWFRDGKVVTPVAETPVKG